MRCLKCGHEYSGGKKNCIYCGASLEGEASREINYITSQKNNIFISEKQHKEVKFNDLPENIRHKIEDSFRKGKKDVVIKEERAVSQPTSATAKQERAWSFEKVLALLSGIKNSFKKGRMDYDVYERMVSDVMKEYLSTLDDNIKIDFVLNEIKTSEIYDYLDDGIIKDLKTFVLSAVSHKKRDQ